MDEGFQSFSVTHFIALGMLILFTFSAIILGRKMEGRLKMWIGYSIASASFGIMLIDLVIRGITGTFDILVDLPLFLCDIVAFFLPVIILTENRKWIGIFYFWSLGGTLQALITPELNGDYPSFEFFRYFIMHGGIVSAILYYVIVMKIRISWKDLINAVIYAQVYLVVVHIINLILRSNYSYTMAKPNSTTILDLLGNWPWYIFIAEGLMIILFILLLIPFLMKKDSEGEELI